jgi:threonine/homoserine/homoserine lactone efflux protein
VLTEARLQARITGASRATVTSLAGMAADLTLLPVYAGYALVAASVDHSGAFVLAGGAYLVLAVFLLVRRRRRSGSPASAGVDGGARSGPVRSG